MIVIDHREKKRQDMLTEAYETPRNYTTQQKTENHAAGPLLACCFVQSSKLRVINNQTNQLQCLKLRLRLKLPAASIVFVNALSQQLAGSAAAFSLVLSQLRPAGTAAGLVIPHPGKAPREAKEWIK